MNHIKLTDKELEYLRYLVSIHAGTEGFNNKQEEILTFRIIDSLIKKLDVQ